MEVGCCSPAPHSIIFNFRILINQHFANYKVGIILYIEILVPEGRTSFWIVFQLEVSGRGKAPPVFFLDTDENTSITWSKVFASEAVL